MAEVKICVICEKKYIGHGNVAEPIKTGWCCDDCQPQVTEARRKALE